VAITDSRYYRRFAFICETVLIFVTPYTVMAKGLGLDTRFRKISTHRTNAQHQATMIHQLAYAYIPTIDGFFFEMVAFCVDADRLGQMSHGWHQDYVMYHSLLRLNEQSPKYANSLRQ